MMMLDQKKIDAIKGFLAPEEGRVLYEIAREVAEMGPCLEIGSYCGKSAVYLGAGAREKGGVLFSIDHHRGSEEQQFGEEYFDEELYDGNEKVVDTFGFFRKSIETAGLSDTVVPIVSRSRVVAGKWATPLSLVFIDGGHSFESAFTDYNCWARHLVPGGYLLIHDIFTSPEEGGQAPYEVYRLARSSGMFKELPMKGTLGILRRLGNGELPEPSDQAPLVR